MSFYDAIRVGASAAGDYEVERSLRFDPNDTYLERTPSSAGNRLTWTFSCWVKRSSLAATNGARILAAYNGSNGEYQSIIKFRSTDKLQIFNAPSGSADTNLQTNALFRDVSAWYHIVVAVDMTQSTASDRVNLYINGVQETSFSTENYGSQNTSWWFNNNSEQSIGRGGAYNSQYFGGYLAEFNLIDGLQLTPASFGETNILTGQWNPKKYTGSYGTNGFYLNFSDNSGTTATTLGKDYSGNGNNYTPYGFSVAAGVGNDSLEDTPTNNFCTLNSLVGVTTNYATFSNGNLDFNLASHSSQQALGSFLIPKTGKWYVEYVFSSGGGLASVSVRNPVTLNTVQLNGIAILEFTNGTTQMRADNSYLESATQTYGDGDIVGIKIDQDAGTVQFTVDGSNASTAINLSQASDTSDLVFAVSRSQGGTPDVAGSVNFGQRPFSYLPTGYKALNSQNLPDPTILLPNKHFDNLLWTGDGNDNRNITGLNFQPDWVWIKERSSSSSHVLTDSVRGIPAVLETNITGAEDTSSGAADIVQAFNSDGFQVGTSGRANQSGQTNVGWNWNAGDTDSATYTVKVVSDSGNKYRFNDFGTSAVTLDLAEGGTYTFDQSDSSMSSHPMQLSTTANGTHGGGSAYSTGVTYELDGSTVTASAFISGFSSASSRKLIITVAASAPNLNYYCYYHSGMGGAINTNSTLGSSNFAGSVQSTVKVNATAGFSIITYTGTGSSTTVGHGLGVKPDSIIIKRRDSADNWMFYHKGVNAGVDPEDYYLEINSTSGQINSTIMLNDTAPTSTSVTIGSDPSVNGSGATYIMYCLSEVGSYSKVGKFTGNGNANGTFVFCGFRPAWVFIRSTSSGRHWVMNDSARNPHNVANKTLLSNANNAEDSGSSFQIDILSNGFKCRTDGVHVNTNAGNHVFLAFAEAPFKNSRAR